MTTKMKKAARGVPPSAASKTASGNPNRIRNRILAEHYCCCKPGVPCIFCLAWNRLIRAVESRMVWRAAA